MKGVFKTKEQILSLQKTVQENSKSNYNLERK